MKRINLERHFNLSLLKRLLISIPFAAVIGSVVALFLWLLDHVTLIRWQHPWLLFLLPLAGVIIHFLYKVAGKNAEGGNALIIDEIHEPGAGVPLRMSPLVLVTTLLTHLFGGSAGREGTAVQIGGSLSAGMSRLFNLQKDDIQCLLACGVAAGFSAVFGTPIAGAIFAIEVLRRKSTRYPYLVPCIIAAFVADYVCRGYGIVHTPYFIGLNKQAYRLFGFFEINWRPLLFAAGAGILFGLAARLFIDSTHAVKKHANRLFKHKWMMPVTGGLLIILLTWLVGTDSYLGLGVTNPDPQAVSIVSSFQPGGAGYMSWYWKLLFTVITIGMGFKGGEVTPLFFIGAALGNAFAGITGNTVDLFAGLGFVAIFGGATNAPLACTLMACELFGAEQLIYYVVACFSAYLVSGAGSIYKR